jgi:hypothetical protein
MNKSTFFSGQPIFTQLLGFLPKDKIRTIAADTRSDRYTKRLTTYEHLVTMLYAIFNNCTSLREVTTGMLAIEQRLHHLGLRYHPRRSTLSDASMRRSCDVFAQIYFMLLKRYEHFLADSRKNSRDAKLYFMDSTTISLFHEVLRTAGQNPASGKRKGGIKVHTLVRSDQDVPCLVRLTSAVANDAQYLKELHLSKGSILVFDRGYTDFKTYNRFSEEGITWITRMHRLLSYEVVERYPKGEDASIKTDHHVRLGHWRSLRVEARLIKFKDPETGKVFEFLTNNFRMKAATIAGLYKKRWQIEMLYKRLKQNYPLRYFLGDSENAIKIQVWCSLIADLLLKVVKKGTNHNWSFANLAAMIRLHLMTYIDLRGFLRAPEKALISALRLKKKYNTNQLLLIT